MVDDDVIDERELQAMLLLGCGVQFEQRLAARGICVLEGLYWGRLHQTLTFSPAE